VLKNCYPSQLVLAAHRHDNTSPLLQSLHLLRVAERITFRLAVLTFAFSALTLLVGRQEGHPACKKQWWGTGMVICLERGADMLMAQLMPLPLTVSCSSKIQIRFTILVLAYPGCPGKEAIKWLLAVLTYHCLHGSAHEYLSRQLLRVSDIASCQ